MPRSARPDACLPLANASPTIAALSFRRIAERHGQLADIREALIADTRLPADCRHMLLVKVGEALRRSPLVVALIGQARAERVTRDACIKACVTLIEAPASEEYAALIEHLRLRGDLTSSFIIRTVAHGKIDFLRFGACCVDRAGRPAREGAAGRRPRCGAWSRCCVRRVWPKRCIG